MNVLFSPPTQTGLEKREGKRYQYEKFGRHTLIRTLTNHNLDILANTGPGYLARGCEGDSRYKTMDEINVA